MNLMKFFNFKYLIQNLKKSKGILSLLILIIPLLTLCFIIRESLDYYVYVFNENTLAKINIIGMYIIPVILSIILYGYVYKKNSVDLINSMPINRSTIYITNFISGIFIILMIQILTLIVSIICSYILTHIYIPIQMMIDIFVVMLVSYIFVFSITSLAMTISGNIPTQIVLTILILFLIPICVIFGNESVDNVLWVNYGENIVELYKEYRNDFNTPVSYILDVYSGNQLYNSKNIIKMSLYSFIYFIIGIILFNKRKMENSGESFNKVSTHFIVKGLALLPIIFLIKDEGLETISFIWSILLAFIYYIVYDFIVSKKISLKYNIPIYIISVLIIIGIYNGNNYIHETKNIQIFNIDDISTISMDVDNRVWIDLTNEALDIKIDDKNIIKMIFDNIILTDMILESEEFTTDERTYSQHFLKIELQDGNKFYVTEHLLVDKYQNIIDTILNIEKYREEYDKMIKVKDTVLQVGGSLLDDRVTDKIENIINSYDFKESLDMGFYAYYGDLAVYEYKNHKLCEYDIDEMSNEEIFELITTYLNNKAYKYLITENKWSGSEIRFVDCLNGETNLLDIEFLNYSKLREYIEKNGMEKCDMNKPCYVFNFSNATDKFSSRLYLNSTEEFEQILKECAIIEYETEDDE